MPSRIPTHQAQARATPPIARLSASAQGYGHAWRKLRLMALRRSPVCECGQPATDVDHIIAKARGGRDELGNLRCMCHRCHSRKTVLQDGGLGRVVKVGTHVA